MSSINKRNWKDTQEREIQEDREQILDVKKPKKEKKKTNEYSNECKYNLIFSKD